MSEEILRNILKEFRSLNKGLSYQLKRILQQLNEVIARLSRIGKNTA